MSSTQSTSIGTAETVAVIVSLGIAYLSLCVCFLLGFVHTLVFMNIHKLILGVFVFEFLSFCSNHHWEGHYFVHGVSQKSQNK